MIVEYSIQQGKTLKEQDEFEETANWIIENIAGLKNISKITRVAKNYKDVTTPKFAKTYVPKLDKYGEIANLLRQASKDFYKTRKKQLMRDIIGILNNE